MYHFGLEPLLKQRQFTEDLLQRELAICLQLLAEEKEKLSTYRQLHQKCQQRIDRRLQTPIAAADLTLFCDYLKSLAVNLTEQKQKISEVEKDVDQKRDDLVAAMKRRKILDKLKEKGRLAYKRDRSKREQISLNDIAIQGYGRKERL